MSASPPLQHIYRTGKWYLPCFCFCGLLLLLWARPLPLSLLALFLSRACFKIFLLYLRFSLLKTTFLRAGVDGPDSCSSGSPEEGTESCGLPPSAAPLPALVGV